MKTTTKSLLLILIISFSTISVAQKKVLLPKPVFEIHNQINVGVFPQVELISIIQTIGEYPSVFGFLMAKDSSEYKTEVKKHFSAFKNHPAVQMFDRLSQQPRMLNFSAPSNIMLFTNNSLDLRNDIELEAFVVNRAGGMDSLQLFLNLLKDFVIQSSFNKFFMAHSSFYSSVIENTIQNIGNTDFVSELEKFYGKKQKSYSIALVSLYSFVGYGNSLICANGEREIYNTMGSRTVKENVPLFGDENYLKYIIRHEFSHPFVNPLTEKYWEYIKEYASNYDSIPEVARKNVCGDWQECINEFVIRAVTTQLAYNESEETGLISYNKEKSRGISYLDNLIEKIRLYELSRQKYPTFESYYFTILDVFK